MRLNMATATPTQTASANGAAGPPLPDGSASKSFPWLSTPAWIQTAQFLARPDLFLERNHRRYGDVFGVRIKGFGTGKHVVISDPKLIEQVFRGSPRALRLGEVAKRPVIPLAGPNSLLAIDAPVHLAHRKILNPPFHGKRMLAYEGIMAEAADRSLAQWPLNQPFPLRPRFADITMEVIMRAVFGLDRGSRHDELSETLLKMISSNIPLSLALTFPRLRRDFGPVRAWSDMLRAKARADALIYDEIATRRRAEDLAEREDILSMLLAARYEDGEPMSDEEIHDELVTMLLAGHETTASALAWAFDLLLHHPAALARLREELAAGEEAYLDAVVNESLRVRPVVATSQRVVSEPIEIDGYAFSPGMTILSAIWLVHRRPDLYPEPLAFRPERFLGVRPATYEWIPFGGGVRRCIGANFAPMEMKVVIKRIVTQSELTPARSELERPRNRVVLLAPRHGTMAIRTA